MRKAKDLTEIMNIAYRFKARIEKEAKEKNKPVQLGLHWSAGRYMQYFPDYHINIDYDGSYYLSTDNFADILYHNYKKNSGSIGICLCCGYDATSSFIGPNPPTGEQIEAMARVIAVLTKALDIPIDTVHVPSHGQSADNEDFVLDFGDDTGFRNGTYGPKSNCERWDLEYLGNEESPRFAPYDQEHRGHEIIRRKAKWYRNRYYGD